jgi:uncharacterized FlaG/YvyC family protein
VDVTSVNSKLPTGSTPGVTPAKAAEHRAVTQAVKALNATAAFGGNNLLRFQRDPISNHMVIQIVDRTTSEVVDQIPQEYVLRLAEDLKSNPR